MGPDGRNADPVQLLKAELLKLRRTKGLTAKQVVARSGLGHVTVSQAFNGTRVPSEATVYALARALNCEVEPLLAMRRDAQDWLASGDSATTGGSQIRIDGLIDSALSSRAEVLLVAASKARLEEDYPAALRFAEAAISISERLVVRDADAIGKHGIATHVYGLALYQSGFEPAVARDVLATAGSIFHYLKQDDRQTWTEEYVRTLATIALLTSEIGDDPEWACQIAQQAIGEAMEYGKEWPDGLGLDDEGSNAQLFFFAIGNYLHVLETLGQSEEARRFAKEMGIQDYGEQDQEPGET